MVTLVLIGFFAACSKDKYSTKPQLKYKGVNTKFVNRNQNFSFTLEVTDAEGDIQDTIWVQQVVRNCSNGGFTAAYRMPDFDGTKNLKGEVIVCFSYGIGLDCPLITHSPCVTKNNSTTFRFWIQDKEKNISDTITSEEVVVAQ